MRKRVSRHVLNFHAWCSRQLEAYNAGKPPQSSNLNDYFEACVERVIRSVDRGLIPSAQYDAVLIDEGHDFKSEWFKLVVQMIHPDSNSLLVLYDDAQSIYHGAKKLRFSFSSVGVQAKGRTTILKLNYRNTAEVLSVARAFADDLLSQQDTEEDLAPTVQPMSTGRHGPKPLLIQFPGIAEEAEYIATKLLDANRTGMAWSDMAVVYRRYEIGEKVAGVLKRRGIPFVWQQNKRQRNVPNLSSVQLITMHSSKGLEFPLVCIPGLGAAPKRDDDLRDEARLVYVAMTRSTQELVMTHGGSSVLAAKMSRAMDVLEAM